MTEEDLKTVRFLARLDGLVEDRLRIRSYCYWAMDCPNPTGRVALIKTSYDGNVVNIAFPCSEHFNQYLGLKWEVYYEP